MKTVISICEKEFIARCIAKSKRLDGRNVMDGRTLEIAFGQDRGCCMVLQGNTRVLAQVTCEITEPRPARPTEGALLVNLELSQMAAPDIKQSRMSDEALEAQSLLERCIRDSKCIDLESLCIVAGSKVWTVKVDVHTLNDDGNLVECASIAAISSLAHFRRPDVTVVGTDVTVHSPDDREPVAFSLHHMPINVNLALYDQGKHILVDPLELEEKIADGCFVIGVNAHEEICVLHHSGVLTLESGTVLRCCDIAIKRVKDITQVIRTALSDDAYKRATKEPIGFISMLQTGTILGAKRLMPDINLNEVEKEVREATEVIDVQEDEPVHPTRNEITFEVQPSKAKERALKILQAPDTLIFEGGKSKWGIDEEDDENEDSVDDEQVSESKFIPTTSPQEEAELSSEEETVFMDSDQVDVKSSGTRGWYSKNPFA